MSWYARGRRHGRRRRPHGARRRRRSRQAIPLAIARQGHTRVKALVTGAAGFIGSHLAERLITTGATVTGIDCFTDYYPRELKERNLTCLRSAAGFRLIESALADARSVNAAGRRHARVSPGRAGRRAHELGAGFLHSIPSTTWKRPRSYSKRALGSPLSGFVYASSSSVYGDAVTLPTREDARPQPVSPYGVTKLAAEQLCHLYHASFGVPAVALRFFTVYGPRQRPDMGFSRFLRAATPVEMQWCSSATGARPATSHSWPMRWQRRWQPPHAGSREVSTILVGGSRVELLAVFELIRRISGRPLLIEQTDSQRGDMRDTCADTTRARADLAFAPAATLEEGLRAQYEWMTAGHD